MMWRSVLDWWLAQLADWVPDAWRRRLAERRAVLVVALARDGSAAHAQIEGRRYELGPVDGDDWDTALEAALDGLPRRPAELEVRLQSGEYLRRDFDLPLAAEASLREAVELQIDRLTPFTAAEVVFQCGVRERDPAAKRLGVWLAAVPASRLHQLLETLGESPECAPRPARAPPEPGEALVLRYGLRQERRGGYGWVLAAANALLLAAALTVHLNNRELELAQLQEALGEVRRDAAEGAELADRLEQLRGAATLIAAKRSEGPALVEVLEELSVRLPDDTYLQRIELRHGELQLFGVSTAASNLIRQLEESPLLADVRFESSVTRDAATGRERFTITGRVVSAAAARETGS